VIASWFHWYQREGGTKRETGVVCTLQDSEDVIGYGTKCFEFYKQRLLF
jgi:hypothetical protein